MQAVRKEAVRRRKNQKEDLGGGQKIKEEGCGERPMQGRKEVEEDAG